MDDMNINSNEKNIYSRERTQRDGYAADTSRRRLERSEYRSRYYGTKSGDAAAEGRDSFGNWSFSQDETVSKRKKSKPKEGKGDSVIRLIALQTVLCSLIVLTVFAASKVSVSAFEKMKTDYQRIMSRNMSIAEIFGGLKEAAKFVFEPVDMSGVQTPSEPALSEGLTIEKYEVTGEYTGEKVAVGEIKSGSGGGDIEGKEAADGTSFAPYYVSIKPVMPVENARITSKFGYRTNPISGKYGFHTGLDLAAPLGTRVSTAFYGRVKETGENDVWGKYILMEHSEKLQTYYCHLSEIYVTENAVIRQGETIGLVGSTGWSTGPHLHFEVRINNIRVDPERLLYPDEG